MLAPEPFFEPRGTPFSEFHRIKALTELGHHVDLVTYPFGRDVHLPALRIFRSIRPPLVRDVPIGPSGRKVILDVLLGVTAVRRARRGRYDVIHSHEEAGVLGVWLARRLGIPHLYDMHSSLPQQLANFRYTRSRTLRRLFERAERRMIEGSAVVVTICQELQDAVVAMGAGDRSFLIENVMGGDVDEAASVDAYEIRSRWGIAMEAPLILYTGTFEAYQGLELLFEAAARLSRTHPEARLLVVGGDPDQVSAARSKIEALGAPVVLTGQQPARDIPGFIDACEVLVSPRTAGTNTPLKIYSYLRSGKPIVATDLLTHTQVLSSDTAVLTPADPESFAAGIRRVLDDPAEAARVAVNARALARSKYSREAYLDRTRLAYDRLVNGGAPAPSS
jgi:glycosyltransferase involved in cell wall biosynthesis